jgi:hypothetical protein
MWVCEKCGAMKGNEYDKCLVCSLSSDVPDFLRRSPDAASPHKFLPIIDYDAPSPQVGMPRRFGIATLMITTVFFAFLFGILKMCGVPPIGFIAVIVFVLGVASCQALLYGGKNPRKASFVAGVVMYCLVALVMAAIEGFFQGATLADVIGGTICYVTGAAFVGGPLGYAAGCLIAAIFLVRKEPGEVEPPPEQEP